MPTNPQNRSTKFRHPERSEGPLSFALAFVLLLLPAPTQAQQLTEPATVRISVLSLFHPKALIVTSTQPLTFHLDAETLTLPPNTPLTVASTLTGLILTSPVTAPDATQTLSIPPSPFTLTVPGKLTRSYRAALTITSGNHNGILTPILEIPTELAVASIVQAEAPPHAAFEALKAQAVVSRSFLLARPSPHARFDACDTTHCQFLRSPPPPNSPAALATRATQNQVLTWRPTPESLPHIVRAMYSRSCGGHTRPHPTTPGAYPYYRVACAFCLRHPESWHRPLTSTPRTEAQRLAYNRTHGWSAIPSNTHTTTADSLEGRGTGHGIGLCQLGANDLAAHNLPYPKILTHFFPNTTLIELTTHH